MLPRLSFYYGFFLSFYLLSCYTHTREYVCNRTLPLFLYEADIAFGRNTFSPTATITFSESGKANPAGSF